MNDNPILGQSSVVRLTSNLTAHFSFPFSPFVFEILEINKKTYLLPTLLSETDQLIYNPVGKERWRGWVGEK